MEISKWNRSMVRILKRHARPFYSKCAVLSNAPDVIRSQTMVTDEFLQPVMGLKADIAHDDDTVTE